MVGQVGHAERLQGGFVSAIQTLGWLPERFPAALNHVHPTPSTPSTLRTLPTSKIYIAHLMHTSQERLLPDAVRHWP